MKILIATNNLDKYNIISKMIKTILGNDIIIDNLKKYPNFKEIEEVGNNIERAKGKAKNAYNQIKDYDIILGIDDGIIIDDKEYVAVKEHLYDIVSGNIKIGTKIYITRAYYMITKDNKEKYCYNKIPYILRKKLKEFDKVGFPLNKVISTIDNDKVLIERTENELNDYFLKYSLNDLKELFK